MNSLWKNSIVLSALSCSLWSHDNMVSAQDTITDLVVATERFSTLLAAVQTAGLADALAGEGPLTVFAPNDEAFAAVAAFSPGTLEALLAEDPPTTLESILLYHVASGAVTSEDIAGGLTSADTLLEGETVTLADPPSVNEVPVLNEITASNGIIHEIGSVLLPSTITLTPGIATIAAEAGDFTTLLALIEQAGLSETLGGAGPFTVFAPNDAAFDKLDPAVVETLTGDTGLLTQVLGYHVVGGAVLSTDLTSGPVPSLLSGDLDIVVGEDDSVMVNCATVIAADIVGSNGVIHVIDTVLVPDGPGLPPGCPMDGPMDDPMDGDMDGDMDMMDEDDKMDGMGNETHMGNETMMDDESPTAAPGDMTSAPSASSGPSSGLVKSFFGAAIVGFAMASMQLL